MDLPSGIVPWSLHDARSDLRSGIVVFLLDLHLGRRLQACQRWQFIGPISGSFSTRSDLYSPLFVASNEQGIVEIYVQKPRRIDHSEILKCKSSGKHRWRWARIPNLTLLFAGCMPRYVTQRDPFLGTSSV